MANTVEKRNTNKTTEKIEASLTAMESNIK